MDTVVIGWNQGEDREKWAAFTALMENIFMSIRTGGFKTDKEHIKYAQSKEDVDSLISGCSVLVCPEELGGKAMGTGSLKAWKKKAPAGLKVITVLDGSRFGGGKCKGLFDNGFYDALFEQDFTQEGLSSVIKESRTEESAYAYYGLDGYVLKKPGKAKRTKKTKEANNIEKGGIGKKGTGKGNKSPKTEEPTAEKEDMPLHMEDAGRKTEPEIPLAKENSAVVEVESPDTAVDANFRDGDVSVPARPEDILGIPAQDGKEASEDSEQTGEGRNLHNDELQDDNAKGVVIPIKGNRQKKAEKEDAPDKPVSEAGKTEFTKKDGDGDKPRDSLTIFTLPEANLMTYLKECDGEAHSYVRPYPELSKTDRMLEQLLDYYTVQNNTWIQNVNNNAQVKDQFDAELWQRIAGNDLDLTNSEKEKVFEEFSRFMWRYDILEPYILDPDVSDIKIYDPWTVQIKVRGKKMAAPEIFRSNLHYRGFIGRIARKNHVDINNKGLARFADTLTYEEVRLRGNIATELLNCNGSPLLHMRKVNNTKFSTEKLIALKMMTPATAAYLVWCMRNGKSIVFCGKGSSGKTTIMNWLLDFFPLHYAALCIQEIDELYSVTHPYIQFQQITSDIELMGDDTGRQKYTLRDLAINGLLTDIDAFFIGEIKGEEALQFTNSANTGNQVMCSVHSENEREALPQIADYSKFGSDYSRADLLKRLTSIDVVVFMQNFQVKSISEVAGWDEDRQDIVYRGVPITVPEKIDVDEKERIMGPERRLFLVA